MKGKSLRANVTSSRVKNYKADCWKDYSKRFQNLQRNEGDLLYEQFLDYFADNYREKTQN
ncbi:type VI secretion system-associated FHA domain protein [Piscirickettsia litoralis]|uniref:type VI secretion system-associated FHA domain protein n=1 Tax=Piscirickettsia litoralis TaxID=1891921 RepID=UPI00373FE057